MQNDQVGRDCRDCSWEDIEEGRCEDCPHRIPEFLERLQYSVWIGTGA